MKKEEMTSDVQDKIAILNKRMGKVHGLTALNKLAERTNSDPGAAQFTIGDEIFIEDDVNNLFIQSFNGRETAGVTVACRNAAGVTTAKALYFSALHRSIPEYGDDFQPTGIIVEAQTSEYHDVYDVCDECALDSEIWNSIKGRSMRVAALNPVKAARYNAAGQVTGVRVRQIPVFTFIDEA